MTAAVFLALVLGAAAGLVAGALLAVAAISWLIERLDRATTVPAPAGRSADVIDLHGRRSTRSWTA